MQRWPDGKNQRYPDWQRHPGEGTGANQADCGTNDRKTVREVDPDRSARFHTEANFRETAPVPARAVPREGKGHRLHLLGGIGT